MLNSTAVTKEAMTITQTGNLTSERTKFRINDTVQLDRVNTRVVASPRPSPLMAVLVTASSGHSPSSATSAWLLFYKPSLTSLPYPLSAMSVNALQVS